MLMPKISPNQSRHLMVTDIMHQLISNSEVHSPESIDFQKTASFQNPLTAGEDGRKIS